jgi:23S rRNA (guanosine2251-2'-O)-methyltransferase
VASKRFVYGVHAVRAVLARRPQAIVRAVLLEGGGARLEPLDAAFARLGVPVRRVERGELDRLCGGGAHQGVAVEARPIGGLTLGGFEELVLRRGARFRALALDGVEDSRNLGACLRSADAAGVDVVVTPRSRSAPLTGTAAKAAAGAVESVPVLRASNLARTLRWLKSAGVRVVGADASARRSMYEAELSLPITVVVGGEGKGLRRLTRELCDELVSIPMHGTVSSLNVSVAVGVVLFELARRAPVTAEDSGGA